MQVDELWPTNLIILGPIPSNPIALVESNVLMNVETCSGVIYGILKYTSLGTLLFVKFSSSLRSDIEASVSLLLKISEMKVKYSFN